MADPNQASLGIWTTGLCGCYEDCSNCCITICCPCFTFGRNAEIIDRGKTSAMAAGRNCFLLGSICLCCLYTCSYRTKLRGLYKLPGNQCCDCCVHVCCAFCALCQEHRELKNRGTDPSVGWTVNDERRKQSSSIKPPTVARGMTR